MSHLPRWLFAVATMTLVPAARAQATLEWDRDLQIPTPQRLIVGKAWPDSNGGWYVTGCRAALLIFPGSPGFWVYNNALLLRLDGQGIVTATQDLAPPASDPIVPVIGVDATGAIIAAGVPTTTTISKLDVAGNTLCTIGYPPGVASVSDIGFAPNGDVHAGGYDSNTTPILSVAGWDSSGTSTFANTLPNPSQQPSICAMAPAGDFAIASAANLSSPGTVAVYGPTGNLVWSGATAANAEITALHFTQPSGLVSAGHVYAGGFAHAQVQAWSASGTPLWTYTESTFLNSELFALAVAPSGYIAAAGEGFDPLTGSSLSLLVLLDPNGNLVWTRSWSATLGHYNDWFRQVLFRSSGEIVAAGSARLTPSTVSSQYQSAPTIASWRLDGTLAWEYVGVPLHNDELCTSLNETPAGSIVYGSKATNYNGTQTVPSGGRLISLRQTGNAFCFGDGTGTACPCANDSAPGAGEGCLSSLNIGGKLQAQGIASIANDTLVLHGSQMTNSSCLYFQGTTQSSGGAGAAFGDGLRCAAGTIVRLRTKTNTGGASMYPDSGDPSVSVKGAIVGAGTRTYQVWYRNAAAFCTPSTFNLSNGVEIAWTP